jgi:VCBS repeat-containing protein
MAAEFEGRFVSGEANGADGGDGFSAHDQIVIAQASQGSAQGGDPAPVDVGKGVPVQQPATAAESGHSHEYVADASNTVHLPANASVENIHVSGDDLILDQADGSQIVIKDGAANVPTFVIGDVELPRIALVAALEASGVEVAFGPNGSISAGSGNGNHSSSGGNFDVPGAGIGNGFGLSALLPPTDLRFSGLERRELFPSLPNHSVSVTATSLVAAGEAAREAGLDGSKTQSPGSAAATDEEKSGIGTINIDAPDGIGQIVINGHTVTGVGQLIAGQFGFLTILGVDSATGAVQYQYTLTEAVAHGHHTSGVDLTDIVDDTFTVTVTDSNGDSASTTFDVGIIDDVPTAASDTDAVAAGEFGPATGNVITDTAAGDAGDSDDGADVSGADGATVFSVASAAGSIVLAGTTVIHGAYGVLTIGPDGSYSYVRDHGTAGGVSDVFTYTLHDGDGDASTATLTIEIGDSAPTVVIPAAGSDATTVYEEGLPARGSEPAGSHENLPSEATSGTIGFSSPDGLQSVSLSGHVLTDMPQTFADGAKGTLTAYYDYAATTGVGTIHYTYTLIDNTLADPSGSSFAVVITDADGDTAPAGELLIDIVDDVPVAAGETAQTVAEDFAGTIGGNVMANDTAGADAARVTARP